MATINFYIQSKKSLAGIYVRLKEGRKFDAKAKTNLVINPNNWSVKKGQPNNLKDEELKALHYQLDSLKSDLVNYYNKYGTSAKIDSQWLKNFINPPKEPTSIPDNLVAYFDYYISQRASEMKPASKSKYNSIKKIIESLQLHHNKTFKIIDVNEEFKNIFDSFCLSKKYAKNTIARAFTFVKTVCYDARDNRIEINYQLPKIKSRIEKTHIIYLTNDEITKIRQLDLEKEHLDNARDWLIISCETGQRVSDFMTFTKEKICLEKNKDGTLVKMIDFVQQKTKKSIKQPLSSSVMEILAKRNGEFPRKLHDQKYNLYIKEVCKLAEINNIVKGAKINTSINRKEVGYFKKFELVSSHVGRRSFATNNYGIIPIPLLMFATGHSTENMFLKYIAKTQTETALQLAEYIK